MSLSLQFNAKSRVLQQELKNIVPSLAKETGFVQRRSKLTAMVFTLSLVLGWTNRPQRSLNSLIRVCGDFGVKISESGLHQRMNKEAVAFLEGLVKALVNRLPSSSEKLSGKILEQFSQVLVVDSSIVTLPDAMQEQFPGFVSKGSAAAIKIQLCWDYLTGNLEAVELEAGREVDQKSTLIERMVKPGSLSLFDLGYFNQDTFAKIAHAGAFFVSRYKYSTALFLPEGETRLDLLSWLKAQDADQVEMDVCLGVRQRLPVRLIACRLPPQVVEERRRKARENAKKKGHTPPQEYLDLLAWSLYITNTCPQQLSAQQVMTIYRMRWQIELVFKLWKSQAKLDHIGNFRSHRVLCQFYAQLIGIILFHWIVAPWRVSESAEISLTKAFHAFQHHLSKLMDAMATDWEAVPGILERIYHDIQHTALKDRRKKQPSTYTLLSLLEVEGLA
jgi:hypothetical protein